MEKNSKAYALYLSLFIELLFCAYGYCFAQELPLNNIKLPPGFKIEIFTDKVPDARSMTLGDKGTLFVGTRDQGKIYAVIDNNQDGKADQVIIIAQGLLMPNGVAFYKGDLYVAEINRVIKFKDIEFNLSQIPAPVIINDSFPRDPHHGWKFISFGSDDMLYVPVGAPCNVCLEQDPRYATIMRIKPDGTGLEIFASGIRNTVGFDWHPETKELWFTDNGRDWLGDDSPPDELNVAPKKGLHFGFPFCHGKNISDPSYGNNDSCGEFVPPVKELGPHVAGLGMRFYTGNMFPEEYKNQIFIAEHGSWNRSIPSGYRVMSVKLKEDSPAEYEVFAHGWLMENSSWGRPVDIEIMPDGALLVSDDKAGVIYRITYQKPA